MAEVLIVDDDEEIRDTLRWVLEDDGHTILEAADGHAGLAALCASARPLVVLLDYMMPKLNGEGMLRAVASDLSLRGRHAFILVTAKGKSVPASADRLLKELRVPIIPKPFDLDDLLHTVNDAARRLAPSHRAVEPSDLAPLHAT